MESAFRTHNGFDWVDGRIVCHTDARHANINGDIHGGVSLSMLDSVMGGSVIERLDDQHTAVTVSLTSNFLRPARIGDVLVASATVRKVGRTMAYLDAEVTRDDTVLVTASGVFAIIARPHQQGAL